MMDIDSMIAVLQAWKAGKQIQAKKKENPNAPGWWSCSILAEPNFQDYDYRAKPEPREWSVAIEPRTNRPYPVDWGLGRVEVWEHVKVREVLE